MRLDWIFLPRENLCAKFYIIIIIFLKNNKIILFNFKNMYIIYRNIWSKNFISTIQH